LHGACECEKTTLSRDYGAYTKRRIDQDDWTQHIDPVAMGPYLTRGSPGPGFITYDDADLTARKVVYALEVRDLGGVFMWELSEDFDGRLQDLLDGMYRTLQAD
jgi:GH18 family chitinase